MGEGHATPTEAWFEGFLRAIFYYFIKGEDPAHALGVCNAPVIKDVKSYWEVEPEHLGNGIVVRFATGDEFAVRVTQTKKAGE